MYVPQSANNKERLIKCAIELKEKKDMEQKATEAQLMTEDFVSKCYLIIYSPQSVHLLEQQVHPLMNIPTTTDHRIILHLHKCNPFDE